MLKNNFKRLGSIAVIGISAFIYILERKKPKNSYKQKNTHDIVNIIPSIISKSSNDLIIANTYQLFDLAEQNNFGLIRKMTLTSNQKILLSLLLIDLWQYLWHRMNHEVKFLWLFHKFHHQDEKLDASSGIRFNPAEMSLSNLLRLIVFIPLGIDKNSISLYEALALPVIIFHHSDINISDNLDNLIKKLIVSPGFHRIHHSKNRLEANTNYSSLLSVWDHIFFTYKENTASNKIDFGI